MSDQVGPCLAGVTGGSLCFSNAIPNEASGSPGSGARASAVLPTKTRISEPFVKS